MTTVYGTMIETTPTKGKTFYAMDDACHATAEDALVEAARFYNEECLPVYSGYRHRLIGIFAMDTESGTFCTFATRKQVVRYVEIAEEAADREERDAARYGNEADGSAFGFPQGHPI